MTTRGTSHMQSFFFFLLSVSPISSLQAKQSLLFFSWHANTRRRPSADIIDQELERHWSKYVRCWCRGCKLSACRVMSASLLQRAAFWLSWCCSVARHDIFTSWAILMSRKHHSGGLCLLSLQCPVLRNSLGLQTLAWLWMSCKTSDNCNKRICTEENDTRSHKTGNDSCIL